MSTPTFMVADLVGFTALTEQHGDDYAADVALAFCRHVRELLPAAATDFKMLGDACLIHVPDAADAVRLGLQLVGATASPFDAPTTVRVGMHTGSAVRRGGDWFGSGVNVAARVVALAPASAVLITDATRVAAGGAEGHDYLDAGVHGLRNLRAPVRLWRASARQRSGATPS